MLTQLNKVELIGIVGSARQIKIEDTALVRFTVANYLAQRVML